MTASPPRRALRRLLGVDREPLTEPPARDGYSVARRALAGLLGVRLAERSWQTPPAFSAPRSDGIDVSRSPESHQDRQAMDGDTITATDETLHPRQSAETTAANDARSRQIALAEQILAPRESVRAAAVARLAAADPKIRLALRKHPIVPAVIISDVMTRVIAVAKIISFRLWGYSSAVSQGINAVDLARDPRPRPRPSPSTSTLATAPRPRVSTSLHTPRGARNLDRADLDLAPSTATSTAPSTSTCALDRALDLDRDLARALRSASSTSPATSPAPRPRPPPRPRPRSRPRPRPYLLAPDPDLDRDLPRSRPRPRPSTHAPRPRPRPRS